jgi:hypothetical protein
MSIKLLSSKGLHAPKALSIYLKPAPLDGGLQLLQGSSELFETFFKKTTQTKGC